MVVEYVPVSEGYPEGITLEEMAEIDANQDDIELAFDDCVSDEIKWEIVDDGVE